MKAGIKSSDAEINACRKGFDLKINKAKSYIGLMAKLRDHKDAIYNRYGLVVNKQELMAQIKSVFKNDTLKTKRPLTALVKAVPEFTYLHAEIGIPLLTSKVYELLMKQIAKKYPDIQQPVKNLPTTQNDEQIKPIVTQFQIKISNVPPVEIIDGLINELANSSEKARKKRR